MYCYTVITTDAVNSSATECPFLSHFIIVELDDEEEVFLARLLSGTSNYNSQNSMHAHVPEPVLSFNSLPDDCISFIIFSALGLSTVMKSPGDNNVCTMMKLFNGEISLQDRNCQSVDEAICKTKSS